MLRCVLDLKHSARACIITRARGQVELANDRSRVNPISRTVATRKHAPGCMSTARREPCGLDTTQNKAVRMWQTRSSVWLHIRYSHALHAAGLCHVCTITAGVRARLPHSMQVTMAIKVLLLGLLLLNRLEQGEVELYENVPTSTMCPRRKPMR